MNDSNGSVGYSKVEIVESTLNAELASPNKITPADVRRGRGFGAENANIDEREVRCNGDKSNEGISEGVGKGSYVEGAHFMEHVGRGPTSCIKDGYPFSGCVERGAVSGKEVGGAVNKEQFSQQNEFKEVGRKAKLTCH